MQNRGIVERNWDFSRVHDLFHRIPEKEFLFNAFNFISHLRLFTPTESELAEGNVVMQT